MCEYAECRVPAEHGEKLCILHLPSPKDVARFNDALYLQIDEQGSGDARNGRFSFVGYCFPSGILVNSSAAERKGSAYVILPTDLQYANFGFATIKGNADFGFATKIEGGAFFNNVKIEGSAFFDYAKIGGDADFTSAEIGGSAHFQRAKIGGVASFKDVKIEGDTYFVNAEIGGDADFRRAKIGESAYFESAKIGGDADFRRAKIGGAADFDRAKIEGDADFSGAEIKGRNSFYRCRVGSISLGEDRPRIRGWGLGEERCGIMLHTDHTSSSFWRLAQLAFSKIGERDMADAAFYFERVWHWKALRKTKAREGARLRGFRTVSLRAAYWALWALDCLLLRWTTAYGASITRLFTTWFVVIGGFGIAFSLKPELIQGPPRHGLLWNWILGFHYSVTTFTTLGLGSVNPGSSRLGMALTSIEALLGALLIALAVLVIGRRFMR